jgi:hypothetical protein
LEWSIWFHHNNIPCLYTNIFIIELELLIPSKMSSQQSWKLQASFWPYYYHSARQRKEAYVSSTHTFVQSPQSFVFSERTSGDNIWAIYGLTLLMVDVTMLLQTKLLEFPPKLHTFQT